MLVVAHYPAIFVFIRPKKKAMLLARRKKSLLEARPTLSTKYWVVLSPEGIAADLSIPDLSLIYEVSVRNL